MKTVSLELARQLKEAGFCKLGETYFTWYENGDSAELLHHPEGFMAMEEKSFAAPTGDDVFNELPDHVYKDDKIFQLRVIKAPTFYSVYYDNDESLEYIGTVNGCGACETVLAEAAGKMWLFLKEKGLLKGV